MGWLITSWRDRHVIRIFRLWAGAAGTNVCGCAVFDRDLHGQRHLSVWKSGAGYKVRTRDPLITNQVLYQSHAGACCRVFPNNIAL